MELDEGNVSTGSLRERYKEATRAELRAAALRLFDQRGYANTSVDEIAAEAGVSRSTFFRYFRSKDAVLAGDLEEQVESFCQKLRARPAGEGRMRALEETLVDFAQSNRSDDRRDEMILVENVVTSDPSLREERAANVNKWQQAVAVSLAARGGRSEPNLEDSLAAAILSQITEQMRIEWRSTELVTPVERLIRSHFERLRTLLSE